MRTPRRGPRENARASMSNGSNYMQWKAETCAVIFRTPKKKKKEQGKEILSKGTTNYYRDRAIIITVKKKKERKRKIEKEREREREKEDPINLNIISATRLLLLLLR